MKLNEIIFLIQKDFVLEWRQKHALGGIVLYLVSTIFITYLSFGGIMSADTWNALFWIIIAFASMNLVLKSFSEEGSGRKMYLFTLVSAVSVIISKTILNTLIMIVLAMAGFLLFSLFLGNKAINIMAYWIVVFAGVTGFASVLTMVSAIASQVKNNFTLMTILGFPLILPMLLILIRASQGAISGLPLSDLVGDIAIIFLLVFISIVLSTILFPYLWKE